MLAENSTDCRRLDHVYLCYMVLLRLQSCLYMIGFIKTSMMFKHLFLPYLATIFFAEIPWNPWSDCISITSFSISVFKTFNTLVVKPERHIYICSPSTNWNPLKCQVHSEFFFKTGISYLQQVLPLAFYHSAFGKDVKLKDTDWPTNQLTNINVNYW